MSADLDLDPDQCGRLNTILDGCFWNSVLVDRSARIGVVILELVGVFFEGQPAGRSYPAILACCPVSRAAASYQVDGKIIPLDLEDLNSALREFNFNEIDDWDIVDPPTRQRFKWRKQLSLDVNISDHAGRHMLELWQDENPFQSLDLAIWFDRLFLFNVDLRPISLSDLEGARKARIESGKDLGWERANNMSLPDVDELVRRIRS